MYKGKVRDVYSFDDKVAMIVSDRISAFDHILPRAIPFKGQVLNGVATHFLHATQTSVPNWLEATPHPNVAIGKKCTPIKLEMVIRGYLAGHAAREYKAGKRILCGEPMPEGMMEGDAFIKPIITPATKAEEGHDEDISKTEILDTGIVTQDVYSTLEKYTQDLFAIGTAMARTRGLILVDTKYEFGISPDGVILLIDEVHTPDSSRYYISEGYEQRQANGEKQIQLSKEFVREWLMANGFQGKEGQTMPTMDDDFVDEVSKKYINLYERLTGHSFAGSKYENINNDIETAVNQYLNQ